MFNVFRRDLSVERTTGYFDDDGLWINGQPQIFNIKASVQATDAEILQTLPEGYRTKVIHTLHTNTELRIAGVNNCIADIVVIDGVKFQAVKVTPWQNMMFATKHYEVVVVKVDDDNVNQ
jgi:hypothetical protein